MGIAIKNITKSYRGKMILNNLSLEIPAQSFTSILAPTGSGKTTLLRIMAGIEKPDMGRIFYNDKDVTDIPVQKRRVSMVYQGFINYPSMTVYENIASPLRVSMERKSEKEIDRKVREIAELLRINHVLNHLPEELSGGEKQRTAIARALIKGSEFIFLDEPLANLDYKLREELRGELKTVFKGTTIVLATPEPIDTLSMSSHVAFLHEGRIIQFGKVHEVYSLPMHVEVGHYFNDPQTNVIDSRVVRKNGRLYLELLEGLQLNIDLISNFLKEEEYLVGIRPQDLSIVQDRLQMISFETIVDFCEIVGSFTSLHLLVGNKRLSIVIYQPEKSYRRGDKLKVFLDPNNIYIYSKKSKRLLIAHGKPVTME